MRRRQNGRYFADGIFKRNFMNENVWIAIKMSLNFVPLGLINIVSALVLIIAWRIYASLGLNMAPTSTLTINHYRSSNLYYCPAVCQTVHLLPLIDGHTSCKTIHKYMQPKTINLSTLQLKWLPTPCRPSLLHSTECSYNYKDFIINKW